MIHVSIYRGARAPTPIAREDFESWTALADMLEAEATTATPDCLESAEPEEQKLALLAWAPHRLADTCHFGTACDCGGGPHRLLRNVLEVTCLVLDVDKCADVETLVARVRTASPAAGLVYESPSSTDDAPRVRIVAPASRALIPEECRPSRFRFAEACGLVPGQGVEGAIDAAKLFFIGRLHGTRERKVWRW